jgi:transposase
VFQLHGVDGLGKAVLKKRLARDQPTLFVSNLAQCCIVIEACGEANYWARVFQRNGHTVKLISPQFVKPFVKTNKNDANDAEAASRSSMNFVPIIIETSGPVRSMIGAVRLHDSYRVNFCELKELTWRCPRYG